MPSPMNHRFSLDKKVAVVTGGAGLYGGAIVDGLAAAGAEVWLASRNLEKLRTAVAERAALGARVHAARFDQAKPASAERLLKQVIRHSGRVDILVNNAAARPMKAVSDPVSAFAESMRINATGLFALSRTFGDHMAAHGGGSIINIGSIQGMVGPDASLYEGLNINGFIPDYFFHKGGMLNFTRFLAAYYGGAGVRCNCISPGGVFSKRVPAAFVRRYAKRTFLGRMARLEDIQGAVIFLAGDVSQYITGINLPVDGGYTAK